MYNLASTYLAQGHSEKAALLLEERMVILGEKDIDWT